MFALRRWWNRHALKTGIVALAISSAWMMRATEGVALYEAYHWLTRPLQPGLNQEQAFENSYILELQQRIVELENQNRMLQQVDAYEDTLTQPGTRAAVIGRAADHWWQHLILNRGSRQGVEPGYIVTGPGGIVGRVVAVSPSTSRVLLISDPTSRVGAKVSRSRVMGVVRGQSNNRVIMEFFEKNPDVKAGDVIVTSSYSRLFPRDVPIGRVESIDLTKSPAPEATIQLSSPLSILEWAVIQPFEPLAAVDEPTIPNLEEEPEGRP
ncbi:rod shape-determining protein MreC [Phormidium sp. FACHB-1136]|jgi:rod shape-determining protein MreC|uniref:rod shape-determining protein MreC n=1 Tax=Phormidium sp. FACHB-1136 TaxID=2692848 RepID=UPI0016822716|nr:rod shape-determining protein MreC [Phormidium sp. FACHB-1136]MBD2429162.1 rod shape-determining protein MreC [Phormidium sp. FACHB-1136]